MPKKYQRYREQIETLRNYGLGLEQRSVYEEYIEWLETHNGNTPRASISRNGKGLLRQYMDEETKREVTLHSRWYKSEEGKALEACKRNRFR